MEDVLGKKEFVKEEVSSTDMISHTPGETLLTKQEKLLPPSLNKLLEKRQNCTIKNKSSHKIWWGRD